MTKSEFIINASIQLAAGEAAYNGGGVRANRVVSSAENLYEELVKKGYIEPNEESKKNIGKQE